jgi:hypothetical protein
MIDDPEEEAWQQLEAKQNKAKATPITDRLALQIAHNALSAIDKETPYPIAKHALMVINQVMSRPVQDWEAIAADQAMTIAMSRIDDDDTQEYKKTWVGLSDVEVAVYETRLSGSGVAKEIETKLRKRNNG